MNLPKFSSLYGRIFAIFWLTMLLVLIAVVAASQLDPRQLHDIPAEPLKEMKQTGQDLTKTYQNASSLKQAMMHIKMHNVDKGRLNYYFTNTDDRWLNPSQGMKQKALNNFITQSDMLDKPQQRLYGRTMIAGPVPVVIAQQNLHMYFTIRWHQPPPFLLQLLDRPIQLLLVVMLISTPLLLWLAWALSKPAMRLEKAAQKVARGVIEYDPELEKGPSEFKQAGASFNQMVNAINNKISEQQRLLSNISHELRSPLTRLRMANALAIRKQGESSELTRIDTEAERLELMINELLELSRQQIDAHQIHQNISVQELWGDTIEDGKFEAEQQQKTLICESIPNAHITGNPNLLISAVENVVRNAIRYCDQSVWVTFSLQHDGLTILIEDDGEGVDDSELDAIFRPFYRVSTARDRHSGGAGLGLAITHNVIMQHSGHIHASRSQHGGLAVALILPIDL
ncbi:envelope stress sensor histidine kinase CpxA [Vibrio sp. CK2-1]|uniref:envelope stress sensor histidine kinase CpxA n=1 Tax=Vibrio sp. CK2-1 TaxID=2912249 RepID=UPI001F0273AA|nr:envelope stress sensor histidine kinase CpxA [Vibrio sp. CK2-1]MCF7355319.1 envelope stress sensor histidine kinase CpxA [Vibrio sp. CK2-1]